MKRISKKNALLELAKLFTTCVAHSDDSNPNHDLVVHLAYVLWMIYRTDCKVVDEDLLSVKEALFSL